MAGANINFKIGYTVDKSGLETLKKGLKDLQSLTLNDYLNLNKSMKITEAKTNLEELKGTISKVQAALTKSYNSSLGSLNASALNNELNKIGIDKIYNDFNKAGAAGTYQFNQLASSVLTSNLKLKETHNILDEMADTFVSTVKWNVASSAMNALQRSVQAAYNYVVKLDSSLNDIRVVTGKSADDMERFAQRATDAAKELSASTRDITEGALIYYQQGDSDADALAKAKITQKAANVSQIDTAEASEYLTAVWNGYQVANQAAEEGMQVYEEYVDKLAAVAATTASDLEESSVAMSKVASAANSMGVDFDQLNAQIATIVSVTRQAPESVGTALKTIYARMGDLSIEGGTDEFGVGLGEVSGQLEQVGIHILDENNNLRDMGAVIEEVAAKWQNWTEAQQQSVAIAIAGKRQYNNLISLFNNWDMYTDALNTSKNAMGTLQEQQDIYEERTTAHLQELSTALEDLYDSAWDSDIFKIIIDGLTGVVNLFSSLVDGIGGGANALLYFGSVATKVFNKQIAKGLVTFSQNRQNKKDNQKEKDDQKARIEQWATSEGMSDKNRGRTVADLVERQGRLHDLYDYMSDEDAQKANDLSKQLAQAQNLEETWKKLVEEARKYNKEIQKGNPKKDDEAEGFIILEDKINNAKDAIKDFKKENRDGTLTEDTKKNLLNASSDLLKNTGLDDKTKDALSTRIKNFRRTLEGVDDSLDTKKYQEYYNKLLTIVEDSLKKIKERRDFYIDVLEEEDEPENGVSRSEQLEARTESQRRNYEDFERDAQAQKVAQSKVDIASTVMSTVSALETVVELYDTWQDKDLSIGQKVSQTFSAIAGQGLMLISNFKGIKESFDTVAKSMTGLNMSGSQLMGLTFGITAAISALVVVMNLYEQAAKRRLEAARAERDEALAKNEELQKTEDLYKTYEKAYASYQETGEGKSELITATGELCTALGEEIDNVALLADNYELLNKRIQENRKEKLEASLDDSSVGIEQGKSALQQNVGSGFDDSIIDLGSFSNTGKDKEVLDFLKKRFEEEGIAFSAVEDVRTKSTSFSLRDLADPKDFARAWKILSEAYSEIGGDIEDATTSKGYKKIGELLTKGKEDWDKTFQLMNETDDIAANLTQSLLSSENNLDIESIDSVDSLDAYRKKFIEKLREQRGYGKKEKTDEEISELVDQYLKGFDNVAQYVESLDLKNKFIERFSLDGTEENLTEEAKEILKEIQDNNEWTLLATVKIDEATSEEAIEKGIAAAKKQAEIGLTLTSMDSINNVMDFYNRDDSKKITKSEQETLDSALADVEVYLKATDGIYGMKSAWDEFEVAQEKGSLAIQEYLQDITSQQNEYAEKTIQDYYDMALAEKESLEARQTDITLMQEKIKGYENGTMPNAFESKEAYEEAKEAAEGYKDELIQIDAQIAAIDEKLATSDFSMDVDMGNVNEILSVGDSILSQSEKIRQAAELIGEGYLVAAEDAETLSNILPGIMDNADWLADGTVRLSKETVQAVLGDQEAILNGDTEVALAKIDNQIDVLTAQREAAYAELKLYEAVASSSVNLTNDQIENIANARQALTNYLIQNGLSEQEAAKATAAALSGNMEEYSQIAAQVASSAADNMAEALSNMANNSHTNMDSMIKDANSVSEAYAGISSSLVDGIKRSVAGAAGSGGSKTKGNISKGLSNLFKGTIIGTDTAKMPAMQDWKKNIELDISKYTKAIAQLQGLRSKLLANQKNAQAALHGAASGAGGKKDTSKGSGSGGGSGKDNEKEADHIDQLEDEADTYHDIDLEISQIETDLKRLQDRQDKLSGKDLIDNLNKQLEVLEKQKKAYKDKIELARMELGVLKESLAAQGVTFASDGYISNYYSALQAKLNHTNEVIAKYNNMSATEQEAFKETVEQAKEDYENFKDQIESYDKLISDTIPDLEDQIQEATDKQIELQIKKFTMEIEVRLEMAEAERKFNEFKTKVIDGLSEDDILGKTKQSLDDLLSYFNTNKTGIGPVQSLTDQLNGTLEELKQIESGGWANNYGDNQAQALEDLKTYYEQLMDQLGEVQDLVDSIKESYLDMIDEAVDAFDKQVDQYEYINDLLAHDIDLIKLLYGEDAYSEMEKYYSQIENNNNKELDFLKKRVAYAYEMMNAETDPEAKEKWQEEWEEALSSLNDKVNDALQNIVDKYVNSVNKVFDELNKKVTGGLGLEYVNDEWDLINKNADAYLDTINGMYEIQKLENKYLDAIDQTDNIANQQKLNDLMNEQLSMLKDKEKLTQYDVDRANALYEIALKEIALQDAQQNKSKMRLRRDSQGNYSYQYVSDQDSIAQAQQDLIEAQNSLYNLDKDKYKQNLDSIYSTYSEFQQKLLELYSDQTISAEERQQKEALLVEQYGELINGLVEQNENIKNNLRESAFDSLANMYEVDVDNFKNMSNEEQDILMNSLIPQWESGVQKMTDIFAGDGGFIPSCSEAFDKLKELTKDYQDSLNELESSAGINFDSISSGYDNTISQVEKLIDSNDELIDRYNQQIDAIQTIISQMDTLISKYTAAKNEAIAATKAAYGYWQAEQTKKTNTGTGGSASPGTTGSESSSTTNGSSSSTDGSSSTGATGSSSSTSKANAAAGGDGVPRVGDVVTYTGGLYYYDSYGKPPTGSRGPGKKVTIVRINEKAPYPIAVKSTDSAYGWLKKSQITGYDTGGYTGDWGDEDGRLALLHKKELVLKDSDTENMLSAIKMVRGMGSLLDSINQSMQSRMSGLLSYLTFATNSISSIPNNSNPLEQNVHIDATFPNATNSKEIEDAFNNLINVASQRAYDNRR